MIPAPWLLLKMSVLLNTLLFIFLVKAHSEPCAEYGCPGRPQYEPFVPAPPGHTPSCAKPGQTFCESLDHYPRQLIKFLIDKHSFDFDTALKDETRENFNTYRSIPKYGPEGYDYSQQDGPQLHTDAPPFLTTQYPYHGQPALVYGAPLNDTHHNGYRYSSPARRNPFLSGELAAAGKYRGNEQRASDGPFYAQTQSLNSFGQSERWWSASSKTTARTVYENPFLGHGKLRRDRTRRQSGGPDSIPLCPTEPQYITPRAALNNQGNWMYVVNLQEQNQKYTQVVRSERCMTNVCNGLCSVPAGYTSRCQQQYVQKRLVALEGSGNRLYTDVFWFPHGCSCQIMLNY